MYYLKKHTPVKSNYKIHNKELLVIIHCLKALCHGASCMQANGAEGRKNDRLRKEEKERNLTKFDRYLQGKRGVPA